MSERSQMPADGQRASFLVFVYRLSATAILVGFSHSFEKLPTSVSAKDRPSGTGVLPAFSLRQRVRCLEVRSLQARAALAGIALHSVCSLRKDYV